MRPPSVTGGSYRAQQKSAFRSTLTVLPHDSRGRNWGRSELNRESDTPKGTGQLPACELVGWLKIEAEGVQRVQRLCTHDLPARVKPNLLSSQWEGAFG